MTPVGATHAHICNLIDLIFRKWFLSVNDAPGDGVGGSTIIFGAGLSF